jgi:Delta24-sterol reductase
MNFGVWGPGPSNRWEFVAANRHLEQKAQELGGKKWLYAHAYCTEDKFWSIYDRKAYDAIRSKYSATYLPSIYDKVKVDVVSEENAIQESWLLWLLAVFWPLSGLYGAFKAWMGGDYLLPREGLWKNQAAKEE